MTDRDATESIGSMIDEVKQKIYPVLEDAGRAMHALADISQGIARGHGNIGRLVKDEDLADQLGQSLAGLKTAIGQVNAELAEIRRLTADIAGPQGVPALLRRADGSLASIQAATRDLAAAARICPRSPATWPPAPPICRRC